MVGIGTGAAATTSTVDVQYQQEQLQGRGLEAHKLTRTQAFPNAATYSSTQASQLSTPSYSATTPYARLQFN